MNAEEYQKKRHQMVLIAAELLEHLQIDQAGVMRKLHILQSEISLCEAAIRTTEALIAANPAKGKP